MVVLYFEQRLIMICPVERGRERERGKRNWERERERERGDTRRDKRKETREKTREEKTREDKERWDRVCVCVCEGRKSERGEKREKREKRETRETREKRKDKWWMGRKKYKQQHNNTHRCQCKTFIVVIILLPP